MKRYITYEEKKLKETLVWIDDRIEWINRWATLMKEQHDGERTNIDMGISVNILEAVKDLKEAIDQFGISTDN